MWRPISSASGRLAVPLKSLKRLSSLRLRVRLRSAAGLASFALAAASGGAADPVRGSLLRRRPASGSFLLFVFHRHRQCFRFHLRATSKLVGFGCFPVSALKTWLGDQDSNLDKCLQRALSYH